MKNLLFAVTFLGITLISCDKDPFCEVVCHEPHVMDTCPYEDLEAQMASFNLNLSTQQMTKEILTPLTRDPNHGYFIDGSVRYLIDGNPITQVNYEIGGGNAIRTDFIIYNSGAPCESQTTSCIFTQPTCDTHTATLD
jgi:hypothetical protein